jgi:hypothetical protein
MGHDLHPDPELGQARRLGIGTDGGVIDETAPAQLQQPTMSPIEIRCSLRVKASITSIYLQGIDNAEIIETVQAWCALTADR